MKVGFKGELRSVLKGSEFARKDGTKGFNVSVTVECDGRSHFFSASEDVYKAFELGAIQKGDDCIFEADYNPQWKYGQFQVKNVVKQQVK